jgi:hypothetical protein
LFSHSATKTALQAVGPCVGDDPHLATAPCWHDDPDDPLDDPDLLLFSHSATKTALQAVGPLVGDDPHLATAPCWHDDPPLDPPLEDPPLDDEDPPLLWHCATQAALQAVGPCVGDDPHF